MELLIVLRVGSGMMNENFWMTVMNNKSVDEPARFGAVRVALLFGTAAIAVAAILTPVLSEKTTSARIASGPFDYDRITTGSVPKNTKRTYTIRKSVLQDDVDAVCIIRPNGLRTGDC